MHAIQIAQFGGPEVLGLVDLPTPEPGPGQLRVRVHAAGVNYFESLMRAGRYAVTPVLPMVPGVEVAGVVDAHGPGVSAPALGARVAVPLFALGQGGGYAQYVVVDAGAPLALPDEIGFELALALMVQGLSALHMLRQARPEGKDVLVTAAAGGLGSLLVQLARRAGARTVVAAAGSADKLDFARGLGADAGVAYLDAHWAQAVRQATAGRGVDVVYDTVGAGLTRQCLEALAEGGELLFAALGRCALGKEDLNAMFNRNQALRGFALLPLLEPEGVKRDMAALFALVASGALRVRIAGRFALREAAQAHRALESRATMGKIVLMVEA